MGNNSEFTNYGNGTAVREYFKEGSLINFRPKSWCGGADMKGIISGHIYTNVLIIESGGTKFMVSARRCWY